MAKFFERSEGSTNVFCVAEATEVLPPTADAVEGHATRQAVWVLPGTTLADVVKQMRSVGKVHHDARGYILVNDEWISLTPEVLDCRCEPRDRFLFKFVLAEGIKDQSKQWAENVLQPFAYPVADLESLRRALAEELPLPLPVAPVVYAKLDPVLAPMFTAVYPAGLISCHITAFMTSPVARNVSENLPQRVWDQAFCNLWRALLALVNVSGVEFDWNVTDYSGGSIRTLRPDLMLWVQSRLCVKFEESDSMAEAYRDLQRKLCFLHPQFYGPMQWILGVGLADNKMVVWAVRHGHAPDVVSDSLCMANIIDRAHCLRLSVNFLRVAITLKSVYKPLSTLPKPFTSLPPCNYGAARHITRTLHIVYPKVVKTIVSWSEHIREGYTTTAYVNRAYAVKAPTLISGIPHVETDSNGVDKFTVVLMPVGHEHLIVDEAELRGAMRDVLEALKALHSAGLVHRDVRWKNILRCGDRWMLIDLETVWEANCAPLCDWLRDWDEETLVEGRYIKQSDLYLVGRLMNQIPTENLSVAGRNLQSKLLRHQFASVEEVLATQYMRSP